MAFLQSLEEGAKEKHTLDCAWAPGLWIEMGLSHECRARRAKGRELFRSVRILIFLTTNLFEMLNHKSGVASACLNFSRVRGGEGIRLAKI